MTTTSPLVALTEIVRGEMRVDALINTRTEGPVHHISIHWLLGDDRSRKHKPSKRIAILFDETFVDEYSDLSEEEIGIANERLRLLLRNRLRAFEPSHCEPHGAEPIENWPVPMSLLSSLRAARSCTGREPLLFAPRALPHRVAVRVGELQGRRATNEKRDRSMEGVFHKYDGWPPQNAEIQVPRMSELEVRMYTTGCDLVEVCGAVGAMRDYVIREYRHRDTGEYRYVGGEFTW